MHLTCKAHMLSPSRLLARATSLSILKVARGQVPPSKNHRLLTRTLELTVDGEPNNNSSGISTEKMEKGTRGLYIGDVLYCK